MPNSYLSFSELLFGEDPWLMPSIFKEYETRYLQPKETPKLKIEGTVYAGYRLLLFHCYEVEKSEIIIITWGSCVFPL